MLGWFPVPLLLFVFFGSASYGIVNERVTGRRPTMAGFKRVVDRLNTDI